MGAAGAAGVGAATAAPPTESYAMPGNGYGNGFGGAVPPNAAPPGYLAYPAQPPQPARNQGLIIGLVVACVVALGGVAAAVLIATGGSGSAGATRASATSAPVQTVVAPSPPAPAPVPHVRHRVRRHPTTPASSPTPPAPVQNTGADRAEIQSVLSQHWNDIASGSYAAAYSLFAPGAAGGMSESSWIAAHQQDALTSASISVSPNITGPTSAVANIINLHTDASSGCFNWSGYYEMEKIGGAWRIGKAKIARSSC
jgi:hypothetical protein